VPSECLELSRDRLLERLENEYDIDRLVRRARRHAVIEPEPNLSTYSSGVIFEQSDTPIATRTRSHQTGSKRKGLFEDCGNLKRHRRGRALCSSSSSSSSSCASTVGDPDQEEEVDPITREVIAPARMYWFFRPNGTRTSFDCASLAEYMLKSGDFSDPMTRLPFSEKDLLRLDRAVAQAGVKNIESVYDASRNEIRYVNQRCQRDAVLGLERYIGELVSNMLTLIENVNEEAICVEDAESELIDSLYPNFHKNFDFLARADKEFARQSMQQYTNFLRGPPNRETRNYHGFRNYCLEILQLFEI